MNEAMASDVFACMRTEPHSQTQSQAGVTDTDMELHLSQSTQGTDCTDGTEVMEATQLQSQSVHTIKYMHYYRLVDVDSSNNSSKSKQMNRIPLSIL